MRLTCKKCHLKKSSIKIANGIASSFMAACAAINPDMAEDFRQEQEDQKAKMQEAITDLEAVLAAHFAKSRTRLKNGRDEKETASPQNIY